MRAAAAVLLALLSVGLVVPGLAVSGQSSAGRAPSALAVSVIPPVLPADSSPHQALVISLLDSSGRPTLSLTNVTIYLSSSNSSVGSIPTTVTLAAGRSFVQVPVSTSSHPGSTTLAATSAGLQPASFTLKTAVPTSNPVALALFLAPPESVTALSGPDGAFAVQAVNPAGGPALSASGTGVVVTGSNGTVFSGPIDTAIPPGADLAYGTFVVQEGGSTTLTALAPDLATGSAQLSVSPASADLTISASPPYISAGEEATVTVSIDVLGMPVPGATVTLTATGGTLLPGGTLVMGADGQAVTHFAPSGPGAATITASSNSALLGPLAATTTVVVTSTTSTATGAPPPHGASLRVYELIPVIVIALVVLAGFLLVRYTLKKRGAAAAGYEAPEKA